jgi:hypothetical protein
LKCLYVEKEEKHLKREMWNLKWKTWWKIFQDVNKELRRHTFETVVLPYVAGSHLEHFSAIEY